MQKEQWRDIPDFPGYQASSIGRIRSLEREVASKPSSRCPAGFVRVMPAKILSPRLLPISKYLRVALGKANRDVLVHYCVATAFLGPRPEAHQVRHLNGNKEDNRVENIEWGSSRENLYDVGRHGRRKLTADDVRNIRAEYNPSRRNGAQIARQHKVSRSTLHDVVHGRLYPWVEPN